MTSTSYSEKALGLARQTYAACHPIHHQLEAGITSLASETVKANYTACTQLLLNVEFIKSLEPGATSTQSQHADQLLQLYKLLKAEEEAALGI